MCWLTEQDEIIFLDFSHTKVRTMSLFPSLPLLLLIVVTASCTETENCENVQKTCPVIACGSSGINGLPGKDRHDGAKGEKGEPGTVWAVLSLWLFIFQRKLPGDVRRIMSYSCSLYFSQLQIIIQKRDTALTLASQTSTRNWWHLVVLPAQEVDPQGRPSHGTQEAFLLWSLERAVQNVSPGSVSPFSWEGIGHQAFGETEQERKYCHVSLVLQQVKDSEAFRALLER